MIRLLPVGDKYLALAAAVPLLYLIAVGFGRWLKRRAAVRIGIAYQFFAITISLYLPLKILDLNPPLDLRRELGAASVLLGALVFTKLLRPYVWNVYFAKNRQTEIPKFLQDIAALIVFLVALMLVLSVGYGQTKAIPGALASSGIVAVILGFAMQDLLGNVISGIALHIGQPFKPGDWLLFESNHAEVIEVNWRSTRLR